MNQPILLIGTIVFLSIFVCWSDVAVGQNALSPRVGVTVQLPVVRTVQFNTVVSVPDGGTLNISGGGGSSRGYNSYRRRRSRNRIQPSALARTKVVPNREFERQWLATQRLANPQPTVKDFDGSLKVQVQADFLSRNVGTAGSF